MPASPVIRFEFEDGGPVLEIRANLWVYGLPRHAKAPRFCLTGLLSVRDQIQPDYPDGAMRRVKSIDRLPPKSQRRKA